MQPESSKATPESLKSLTDQNTTQHSQHGFNDHDERTTSLLHTGAGLVKTRYVINETEASTTNAANFNHVAQEYLQWMSSRSPSPEPQENGAAEQERVSIYSPRSSHEELKAVLDLKDITGHRGLLNITDLPNGSCQKLSSPIGVCLLAFNCRSVDAYPLLSASPVIIRNRLRITQVSRLDQHAACMANCILTIICGT